MQIIVLSDEAGKEELKTKKLSRDIDIIFIENALDIAKYGAADGLFILQGNIDKEIYNTFTKPVFINSTIDTLKDMELPANCNRINGWPTFINREIWEIATNNEDSVKEFFERLGWKYISVSDEPGLVSARIISMIINEAYFALGENVSTKDEIDLAMKLGTNYPIGPFEWSKKIGLNKIYGLLEKLSIADKRYTIATAMKNDLHH